MKTKNNLALLMLTSLMCLLPIVLSLVLYDQLPPQIAVQWSSTGEVRNRLPKGVVAFGLPALFFAVNLYSNLRLYHDPKRENGTQSRAIQLLATWIPSVLSLVLVPLTLFMALGAYKQFPVVMQVMTGIMLIVFGNYLPKCRQNYTIGIKLPWTLHDAENWNKTHRMAGFLWMLGGLIMIVVSLLFVKTQSFDAYFVVCLVLVLLIVPMLYSFLLYHSRKGQGEAGE